MNPARQNRELPGQEQLVVQGQGVPSIWSSIGRLKTELRLMGHRLQNVGEDSSSSGQHQPYTFSLASLVDRGNMPGVALPNDQSSAASKPTGPVSPVHLGTRRKVVKSSDDKSLENGIEQVPRRPEPRRESRPSIRSREDVRPTGHGLRADSPRRVDFTKAHQLREVNWDGTYEDSLAYPPDIHGTSDTNTNSRDLRETDIHFLNFSHAPGSTAAVEGSAAPAALGASHTSLSTSPYAPPPSASNSVTNCNLFFLASPPSTSSSSFTYTTSSPSPPSLREHTQQSPDVRWPGGAAERKAPPSRGAIPSAARIFGKASTGARGAGPRLAQVDALCSGSARTNSSASQSPGPSLAELKRRELIQLRKHVEEKWASSNNVIHMKDSSGQPRNELRPKLNNSITTTQQAMDGQQHAKTVHSAGETGTASHLGRLEAPRHTSGVTSSAEGAMGGSDLNMNSPKRPLPIKMPITADLKEDEIILKLKERLKHQRALASISSTNTSNDTSLANSSESSAPPPALPPRQPLTNSTTPRVPASRKVAASHPSPSYRGFSGPSSEQQTPNSKPNTKWSAVKKKKQNLKKPVLQTKKQEVESVAIQSVRHTVQTNPTNQEKPKKATRVVAPADKTAKPSKNIITTSTWRTAQELMKELGLTSKSKSKSATSQQQQQPKDLNETVTLSDHERTGQLPDGAEADIGPAAGGGCHGDGITETRHLSQEAKSVLNDIQAGLTDSGTKPKIVVKPAVKRKAPKPSEPEKQQQPSEKTRHYDQESVRRFIAEQKAKRLKKQMEDKMASIKANEKKQQMLQELVERQKKQAVKSAALGRHCGDGERKRKRDDKDDVMGDKENMSHDSTLSVDTGDESTPHMTPRDMEEDMAKQKKPKEKPMELGATGQHQVTSVLVNSSANCDSQEVASQQPLNVESILDRFSQVVNHRRKQETASSSGSVSSGSRQAQSSEFRLQGVFAGKHYGDETAFAIGTSNSIARTNEKRKEAIKATALTLQSKLAEERRRLEDVHILETSHQPNPASDFVSRYSRLTGNRNDYTVFNSDLPGTQHLNRSDTPEHEMLAATRIQAAYRGHNVRQALNWELPSGQTLGQRLKGKMQAKANHQPNDGDVSDLTDTSTFSEITRTEPCDGLDLVGNRRSVSARTNNHDSSSRTKPTAATYHPPSQYSWVESKADPYSVMSVFSRQNRYLAAGSRQADMPYKPAATVTMTVTTTTTTSTANTVFATASGAVSQKPVILSVEQVSIGHTGSGQPIVAKSRYTRVEATVSEPDNSDMSTSQSESASPARHSRQMVSIRSHDAASKSEPAYTMTYESYGRRKYFSDSSSSISSNDEDDHVTSVKKSAGYKWQMSDAGVETDVSQMSEDEPRHVRSKLDSVVHQAEPPQAFPSRGSGDGRLSPNSLANKFSATLTYMESMEESLRQVVGMERTRGICLAQQETVSLAQVLKARQQEHSAELRALQFQARKEATEATQQLDSMKPKAGRSPASGVSVSSLLEKEDNLRPESRSNILSRSSGHVSYSTEDLSQSPGNIRAQRSSGTALGKLKNTDSMSSSVVTAEDSQNSSQTSMKTAQDSQDSRPASISEVITKADDSYSMSFDDTLTDEESFRQVLPSESHRRRHSGEFKSNQSADASTSNHLNDLSSLFAGEDSFTKFTAEMVRQIMKEEEYRAQHQAALLNLRQKALQEKAKAELAWLQQLKQKPHNKGADDVFPNIDKREKKIKQNLKEQQAEIRRLQEANELASKERQLILQQHEEIAKIKQTTQATLQKLNVVPTSGRLARPAEVHTEDETEATTDVTEDIKDSKSDSEVYKDKSPGKQGNQKTMEKQQKMRLDVKYMTAREQRLHERKKHAKELLEWKKRLDAEEQKVYQLEKKAIQAWEAKNQKKQGEIAARKTSKTVPPSKVDDSNVISDRILSSIHDEMDGAELKSRAVQQSISEVISTQLSAAESVSEKRKRSESKEADKTSSSVASGSESSIQEEIPASSRQDKQKSSQAPDSGDETVNNSAANDDYTDTFERELPASWSSRRKSPVGRLLPQGNSPLPSPWSRRAGSESESEDSISHTETLSDASDYEARIRQLSDEVRRRRKEVELLKKERSRRQKEKFKAQEEALKKQLEAYNNFIQQLMTEKDELEHVSQPHKSVVKPQIKQPHGGHHRSKDRSVGHGDEAASNSSSFEEARDSPESNHTSPSAAVKDSQVSSGEDKSKKKVVVSLMDKISEGSESMSDLSATSGKAKENKKDISSSSSVQEVIEEADTNTSEKTPEDVLMRRGRADDQKVQDKVSASVKDDDASYTLDFSDMQSSLAQSHSKVPLSARSQGSVRFPTDSEISEQIEEPASAKSASVKSSVKLDNVPGSSVVQEQDASISSPATGIQESDSDETESRGHSYRKSESSSRPSSERSTVSNASYTDMDEDADLVSSGSEKTPVKSSQRLLPDLAAATSLRTEDDISEHITGSLPSISDRQKLHSVSYKQSQDVLDSVLGYTEEEENELDEDKTPVATPREMAQTPVPDEEGNDALLQKDLSLSEEEVKSPDDSVITDDEEEGNKTSSGRSMLHSTPVSSPFTKEVMNSDTTPVKRDFTQVAETITDHLAKGIIKDSVSVMEQISQKKTSVELSSRQVEPEQTRAARSDSLADKTTDSVMKFLMEEAIADMVRIKKQKLATNQLCDANSSNHLLVNGHLDENDLLTFEEDKLQDNDSGLSLEPIHRPGSPLPGDKLQDMNHKMSEELRGLFGEEYIDDDDYGFGDHSNSIKPPPPYPGSDQLQGGSVAQQTARPAEMAPVVPLTKEAITPIVSRAVDIYWNNRRYGESLEGVAPPHDFLSEDEEDFQQMSNGAEVIESRKSWKIMLFDLTGEIIRDIYQNEDKPEPPVWQKIPQASQRFFKGGNPPTTVDALRPIVETSVFKLLDLNGSRKALQVNKWNIRKKKDVVDAVLSQELAEDEKGWVDYSSDELNLKMTLTNSLFDSLLSDTAQTFNGIYQRRHNTQL